MFKTVALKRKINVSFSIDSIDFNFEVQLQYLFLGLFIQFSLEMDCIHLLFEKFAPIEDDL